MSQYTSYTPFASSTQPLVPKKRNQVRESMISMMSQAFEFEDFLGETTTMKDRVPKNKNNTGKTIVHFSRDVGDELTGKNPLQTTGGKGLQRQSTFEMYMDDLSFNKPKQEEKQEFKFKQQQGNYGTNGYRYEESVGTGYDGVSSVGYLSFKDKNPSIPNSYVSKYSISATDYSYYDTKMPTPYTQPSKQQPFKYATTFNYTPTYSPIQTPTFPTTTTTWDSVSQQQNYNPTPSSTTSAKKYDLYGDYAKDFSSPDIMAILNKRSNNNGRVMDEKSMNYSNYSVTY